MICAISGRPKPIRGSSGPCVSADPKLFSCPWRGNPGDSNLSELCISGAVADRWAYQGVHCKLRIGFVFRDGEFEIRNDASPSFAQADRSLSKIHGVRYQPPFRLPDEIRMFDEGSESVEYSYRFVAEVERYLIVRSTYCMCMPMNPKFFGPLRLT